MPAGDILEINAISGRGGRWHFGYAKTPRIRFLIWKPINCGNAARGHHIKQKSTEAQGRYRTLLCLLQISHPLDPNCTAVTNVKDRIGKLKSSNRCFLSLNHGHSVKNCKRYGRSSCSICKRSHHRSICIRSVKYPHRL